MSLAMLGALGVGLGIVVNLVGLGVLIWKGGQSNGIVQQMMRESIAQNTLRDAEDRLLRNQTAQIAEVVARTVAQMDALEGRVERLERRDDRRTEDREH